MPGLLNQQGGAAPQAAPAAAGPQQQEASPEEQAAYEAFVDNGMRLIYDKKTMPQVLEQLRAGEDRVEALADTATFVVMRLEDSARESGQPVAEDVLFQGGVEILEDLANLAKEAGIHDYSEEEMEAALYRALDLYRGLRQGQGQIDQGAAEQRLAQYQQADQSGELARQMPGLDEHFANAGPSAGSPPPQRGVV